MTAPARIAFPATLDTKGAEAAWLKARLNALGVGTVLIDAGSQAEPATPADVERDRVFAAAGVTLSEIASRHDRGFAVAAAAGGCAAIVREMFDAGEIAGVIGLGGSAGTTIGTAAMRELPLGVPKLMISTLASGQTRPYVGGRDILMLNSVTDIAGLNRISRAVFDQAAPAMAGLLTLPAAAADADEKPIILASMFGVTTPCVRHAQQLLETAGYEVIVFHATGNGGEAMEGLIADGLVAGVLDITTTELADELVGGILSAGSARLTAAARYRVPQVVSVGATDMINFGPPETVPERFRDRLFHQHNPTVTLMRTTSKECAEIGADIGRKLAAAAETSVLMLPVRGVSAIDVVGQSFCDAVAREALFNAIAATAGEVEIHHVDAHINDEPFAEAAAHRLLKLIEDRQNHGSD